MKGFVNRFANYTIDFIIAVSLSFSLIYACTCTLKMSFEAEYVFRGVCIAIVLYSILFANKLSLKIFAILSLFVLVCAIVYFFINPLEFNLLITKATSLFTLIDDQIDGDIVLSMNYQRNILLTLTSSISLVVYIFSVKKFNFYILLIGGASIFVGQWIVDYFVIYFSFYIFLFFIMMCYLKYIYIRNIKGNRENFNGAPISFVLSSVPICAVVLISAYYLSARDNPIELRWIDSRMKSISDRVKETLNIGNDNYFKISSTGFGESSSRLGGNVSIDNTLVMKVDSPKDDIYLKGAVRDIYTGYSWESKESELDSLGKIDRLSNFNYDLFELFQGSEILLEGINLLKDGVERKAIEITYENLNTNTLFIPLKVEDIIFETEDSVDLAIDFYGIPSSENTLRKGFKYTVGLYNINENNDKTNYLLRNSNRGSYKRYIEDNSIGASDSVITLDETSNDAYDKYLQLPNNLPERINDLALEITASAYNDYDRAKDIESYLSKNYKYTLKPGSTPKDRDFVDYFLFDLGEGYCTYYASAMTVLARSIGIPARYVEGYVLPEKPTSSGIYEVTNEEAHAWVEVYFEGLGWISFEPTAAISEPLDNTSEQQIPNTENQVSEETEVEENNDIEDSDTENNDNISEENLSGDVEDNIETKSTLKSIVFIGYPILTIAVLVIVMGIFPFFKRRIIIYRLQRYSSKKDIIKMYKYFSKVFSVQGLKIKIGETPLQYAQRIDETLEFNELNFRAITDIFNKTCYSNEAISKEEVQVIIDFYNMLPTYCKKRLGVVKYLIFTGGLII